MSFQEANIDPADLTVGPHDIFDPDQTDDIDAVVDDAIREFGDTHLRTILDMLMDGYSDYYIVVQKACKQMGAEVPGDVMTRFIDEYMEATRTVFWAHKKDGEIII